MRQLPATTLVALCCLAGCATTGEGTMPGHYGTAAFTAAGRAFDNSVSVSAQIGDFVRTDSGIYQGAWLGNDMVNVNVSYRHFDAALGDTGWTEIDAYRAKCGGFAVDFDFTKDTFFGGYNEYVFNSGYTAAMGDKGLIGIGAGYGVDADGSTLNLGLCNIDIKYYAGDNVRLGTGWRYSRYWDDSGSLSYHFYGFGLEYLLGETAPVMLGVRYERQQLNNSPGTGEAYSARAAWYLAGRLRADARLTLCYGVPARFNTYDLGAGFRLSETVTLNAGYGRFVVMGGGIEYNSYSAGVEAAF